MAVASYDVVTVSGY